MDHSFTLSDKIRRAAQLVQKRYGLRVERFTSRAQLRAFVPRLEGLYNAALEGTSGNTPLTPDEARSMAQQIIWFADPRLIKLIYKDWPILAETSIVGARIALGAKYQDKYLAAHHACAGARQMSTARAPTSS